MEVVRENNLELIRAVDRAKTVTVSALRVAVTVAGAPDAPDHCRFQDHCRGRRTPAPKDGKRTQCGILEFKKGLLR